MAISLNRFEPFNGSVVKSNARCSENDENGFFFLAVDTMFGLK